MLEMSSSAFRFASVRSAVAVEFVLEMRMMMEPGCGTIDPIDLVQREIGVVRIDGEKITLSKEVAKIDLERSDLLVFYGIFIKNVYVEVILTLEMITKQEREHDA